MGGGMGADGRWIWGALRVLGGIAMSKLVDDRFFFFRKTLAFCT